MNFIRRERKPYYFYLFNDSLNRMNNMKDPESRAGETERRKHNGKPQLFTERNFALSRYKEPYKPV